MIIADSFLYFLIRYPVIGLLVSPAIPSPIHSEGIVIDSTTKTVSVSEFSEWVVDTDNVWMEKGIDSCQYLEGFLPYQKNAFVYRQFSGPPILKFTLNTTDLNTTEFVLHLRNTEIDRVQLLVVDVESGLTWKSKIIGDTFKFRERYFFNRILAIPFSLESHHSYICYLGIEKENRLISSIIEVSDKGYWENRSSQLNIIYGLLMGTFLAFTLISLSMFFIIRQTIYLYYGLYILSVFLILFSIHGYSFRFFYPENPNVSQYFMLLVQFLAMIFGNLYAFSFIGFQHHLRILNPLKSVFIGLYLFGIVCTVFDPLLNQLNERFLNGLFITSQVFNISFLFVFSLYYYLRFKKMEALIYFISFSALGLAVMYTNLSFFVPSLTYVPAGHSLIFGLTVEILILAVYMIISYKSTENKRLEAEGQIKEEKIKNQFAMINAQEVEKRKISLYLHDHVGSSIILVKQKLEFLTPKNFKASMDALQTDISRISGEIRTISHELVSVTLEEIGLVAATRDLIKGNEMIHFTELTPTYHFDKDEAVQLYRILQELIKNSIQHAQANHISIQFLTEPESFQLTYEDDGIGLDQQVFKKGLGFKSLTTRVNMLKGSYQLESEPGRGFLIIIHIPLENHGFGDSS